MVGHLCEALLGGSSAVGAGGMVYLGSTWSLTLQQANLSLVRRHLGRFLRAKEVCLYLTPAFSLAKANHNVISDPRVGKAELPLIEQFCHIEKVTNMAGVAIFTINPRSTGQDI